MRVFLSHAHTPADRALAVHIAARLRATGVDVWMDQASLNAAQPVRRAIEDAVSTSDHGIFLVSQSWMDREWTEWELGLFERRDPALVRRVPVLRQPRRDLQLPPLLFKFAGVEWLDDDPEPDARFWELHCAINGIAPGPPNAWSVRGRDLGEGTARPEWRPQRAVQSVRPSLRCDRAPQWKTVDDLATSGGNELILVPGRVGQDHDHFSQRIQSLLRADPPRSIARIDWPIRPASRDEYREALARALEAPAGRLEAELGSRLSHNNLVLLHPCVRSRFLDDELIAYYSVSLPSWIEKARPRMNVKCVQPVEWPRDTLGTWISRWIPGRVSDVDDSKDQAATLIHRLLESAAPLLRAIRLQELQDISRTDLDDFCQVIGLTTRQSEWLIERIDARHVKTAKDVFQSIDDYVPDARSIT